MFDAEVNGEVGGPQARLAALDAKFEHECRMARFNQLPLQAKSDVYVRVLRGESMEKCLQEYEK
jgi:hypothetical protein